MKNTSRLSAILTFYKNYGITFLPYKEKQTNYICNSEEPDSWENIENKIFNCHLCEHSHKRTHSFVGLGSRHPKVLILSDFPSASENKNNELFSDNTQEIFQNMIFKAMKLSKDDFYVTPIVKCYPTSYKEIPDNQVISHCLPFLKAQIRLLKPDVILIFGEFALSALKNKHISMKEERGKFFFFDGVKAISTYHPADILSNYTVEFRKLVFDDLKKIIDCINKK